MTNTNNELKIEELDAIVGGSIGHTLGLINYGVGLAVNPGVAVAAFAWRGASEMAADGMMQF
jgi:hypothetical protein